MAGAEAPLSRWQSARRNSQKFPELCLFPFSVFGQSPGNCHKLWNLDSSSLDSLFSSLVPGEICKFPAKFAGFAVFGNFVPVYVPVLVKVGP